jgi:hypothetical protein
MTTFTKTLEAIRSENRELTERLLGTIRAIKCTDPNECRYHRHGEEHDLCTWASESSGAMDSLRNAPNWLRADAIRLGPIRKTDCEGCLAFAPMLADMLPIAQP